MLVQQALKAGMVMNIREGRFPHFADVLYQAGVISNTWTLPTCHSLYITRKGPVSIAGEPLVIKRTTPNRFDEQRLYQAIQKDLLGHSCFRTFLTEIWSAGVVSYTVDFITRTVTYYAHGDLLRR